MTRVLRGWPFAASFAAVFGPLVVAAVVVGRQPWWTAPFWVAAVVALTLQVAVQEARDRGQRHPGLEDWAQVAAYGVAVAFVASMGLSGLGGGS